MPLRDAKGNMYGFITHTWNPIKGRCLHGYEYCYMMRFPLNPVRLDEKELKTDLGENNYIFVGSGTDMWAPNIPENWIANVVKRCSEFPENEYLFQTKNPSRFFEIFPERSQPGLKNILFCTTIESNRIYDQMRVIPTGNVSTPHDRAFALSCVLGRRMVTVEPIMDFDLHELVYLIAITNPEQVNIGADSGGNDLPEPAEYKIHELIKELEKITRVHLKPNLSRIYSGGEVCKTN